MGPLCSKVSFTPLTALTNSMPTRFAPEADQITNIPTSLVTLNDTANSNNEYVSLNHIGSHVVENFILVWIDFNIDESNNNTRTYITRLQSIINSIKIFTNLDQCVDFITDLVDEKVLMIISGDMSQQFVPIFQELIQLWTLSTCSVIRIRIINNGSNNIQK
jgi:hypothetical protein